jgi:hypothetical protein
MALVSGITKGLAGPRIFAQFPNRCWQGLASKVLPDSGRAMFAGLIYPALG